MTGAEESPKNELFVILGTKHDQRFEVVWQMADYLIYNGEKVTIHVHEDETELPDSKAKDRLMEKGLEIEKWSLIEGETAFQNAPKATKDNIHLFISHSSHHLVDTLETLSLWLPKSQFELQRILTWVDSQRYADEQYVKNWYDCCFHFSDLVLLDEFKELGSTWLKGIKEHFKNLCFPCIIQNTKKGRISHLNIILDNQALRISQVFENPASEFIDYEIEGDEEDDEETDDLIDKPIVDQYFERLVDGSRSKPLQDL